MGGVFFEGGVSSVSKNHDRTRCLLLFAFSLWDPDFYVPYYGCQVST